MLNMLTEILPFDKGALKVCLLYEVMRLFYL